MSFKVSPSCNPFSSLQFGGWTGGTVPQSFVCFLAQVFVTRIQRLGKISLCSVSGFAYLEHQIIERHCVEEVGLYGSHVVPVEACSLTE